MAADTQVVRREDGTEIPAGDVLGPWIKRRDSARKARRQFEGQWMTNQEFAAGRQWAVYSPKDHRVYQDPRRKKAGRSMLTADVLTERVWTAIGQLATDDFRPDFLFEHNDREAELYAQHVNKAFTWGWEEEWAGDQAILDVLLTIATYGTGAVRCRYDRTKGALIAAEVPHQAGQPMLDPEKARAHMAEAYSQGQPVDLRPMREGAVVWEILTPWNLLPPPGVFNERDFPWEIIVRPVDLDILRQTYGDTAKDVQAASISSLDVVGGGQGFSAPDDAKSGDSLGKLEHNALVYTGYQHPNQEHPYGQTVVFSHDDVLLDIHDNMPYQSAPRGPRSGLTYFHYRPVKQRFFSRSLIENGIGPQRVRNKRISQIDEIIDRGLPKVYVEEGSITGVPEGLPVEQITVKAGSGRPQPDAGIPVGAWMLDDVRMQDENIEKALGTHGVSVGENPANVNTYGQLALLREADLTKNGPISRRLKLGIADVSRDTLESMRNWPADRTLLIEGDEGELESFTFNSQKIPATYIVRPSTGAALPRGQGAELQKINDVWNASLQIHQALPLSWYVESLNAAKMEPLPDDAGDAQRHKAALENVVMLHTGRAVPVASYDDNLIHAQIHTQQLMDISLVPGTEQQQQAIEQHRQEHLQQAQQNSQANQAQIPGQAPSGPPAPPGLPGLGPQQPGNPGPPPVA